MDLGLKGKVAAVAAASQGLGFSVARRLALEGARVGICSRDRGRVEDAASRISSESGESVYAMDTDLAEGTSARDFVEAVADHFGGLHVLVTNAGGPPPGGFGDIGDAELDRGYHLTLLSTINMIKAAVERMRPQQWGRIVNVLSVAAKQPETNLLVSDTMRAGLLGYTKSVSQELAPDNVLINNVAPGFTRTERLTELASSLAKRDRCSAEEVFARWEAAIPMGRLGEPDEFANVVAFLCSQPASYVTGTTVQVDGGFIKGLL